MGNITGVKIMKSFTIQTYSMILMLTAASVVGAEALTPNAQLGKAVIFDTNLSINSNMACAACDGPTAGWTGPESDTNAGGAVYEGSIAGRFGNRKPCILA